RSSACARATGSSVACPRPGFTAPAPAHPPPARRPGPNRDAAKRRRRVAALIDAFCIHNLLEHKDLLHLVGVVSNVERVEMLRRLPLRPSPLRSKHPRAFRLSTRGGGLSAPGVECRASLRRCFDTSPAPCSGPCHSTVCTRPVRAAS